MDKLYAPWRHDYVTGTARKKDKPKLKNDCIFCQQFEEDDDKKNLIIKRYKHCTIMLNRYPYNAGHLLILPLEHKGELEDLSKDVREELMELINNSIEILKKVLKPQGFNVGLNIGSAGGGGIPSHLHFHVLPRWNGDTNYLTTIGEVKVISSDFYKIYDDLKKEFEK
ncbi:HIT domain-containing protein [Candidatus Dependentiae bacterium]|nr:HIT domain-containing protein [Candidatus Dependentiae bacterium]